VTAENAAAHRAEVEAHRELLEEGLVRFVERGFDLPATTYVAANARRDGLAAQLAELYQRADLLVTPTVALPPFAIGETPREIEGRRIDPLGLIPFTYPFNLTGNPAASVPCGKTADGLPVGLQIVGPLHSDALVLDLAAQFESARPWSSPRV